jgi:hypothetical protein
MIDKLQSGLPYCLSKLFCGDRKIIIPDLQRDYCWGGNDHGDSGNEIISGFLDSLFDGFNEEREKELQLGMIYAYENPVNYIQLCDGQQRITTLFLLMGMLNRRINSYPLSKYLISDYEKHDDKEPYLQYAIRESTLYFLSDLVCEFFLKNDVAIGNIKDCSWYFMEYDLDPSINSMLNALNIIEKKLGDMNVSDFSDYLLKNVRFFYFDMVNRKHGEEMFVIINTTGEPLTPTENLKPFLIGNISNKRDQQIKSEMWEEWEKWFWQKKMGNETEADQGLNDFLIWYWQIKLKQESDYSSGKLEKLNPLKLFKERPVRKSENDNNEYSVITIEDWEKAKSLDEVQRYFIQLKIFWGYFQDQKFRNIFHQINKDADSPRQFRSNQQHLIEVILPMLEFMVKFQNEKEQHYSFLRRLRKNYFDGQIKERNNNHVDWRHLLQMIEACNVPGDIFNYDKLKISLKRIPNVISNPHNWFNPEEQIKNRLKLLFKNKIEDLEDHIDFKGDLSPLFRSVLFGRKKMQVKNSHQYLNADLNEIIFDDDNIVYLFQEHEIQDLLNDIEKITRIGENLKTNVWFKVLEIRFNRLQYLWYGTWSFGRANFEYKRWHPKKKTLYYQNWFYYIISLVWEMKENEVSEILRSFCFAVLTQYISRFFDTNFDNRGAIDRASFEKIIETKSESDNKDDFYFWNGFFWVFMLALHNPSVAIDFEVVFDIFDRQNVKMLYNLGNQFVWSKGYYDKSIKITDNFPRISWDDFNPDTARKFIEDRRDFLIKSITEDVKEV